MKLAYNALKQVLSTYLNILHFNKFSLYALKNDYKRVIKDFGSITFDRHYFSDYISTALLHTLNCTFAHEFGSRCTLAHVKYALLHTILTSNLHFCTLCTNKICTFAHVSIPKLHFCTLKDNQICTFAHVKSKTSTFALGQIALLHTSKCTFAHVSQSRLEPDSQ